MPAVFTRDFQPPLLRYWRTPYLFAVRGFHPVSRSIPGDFTQTFRRWEPAHTPHCPKASVWAPPRSLAVTDGIPVWSLFLPLLRCFSSRRSPLRKAIAVGIPIRGSRVLSLRAAPPGLSQLGTPFVGARAEPSTRWQSSHAGRFDDEQIQLTPGLRVHTASSTRPGMGACIGPSHPRLHGVVHR